MNLPLNSGVKILASHECGLLALDKPTGLLAHPNHAGVKSSSAILKAPYNRQEECFYDLGEKSSHDKVYLLNRIDSATSGIILVSLNLEVAQVMREMFERQRVEKTYLAILKGRPPGSPDIWVDRLQRASGGKGPLHMQAGGHTVAKTRIQWLGFDENRLGLSLMRLIPYTGRTHQLRVSMWFARSSYFGRSEVWRFLFQPSGCTHVKIKAFVFARL